MFHVEQYGRAAVIHAEHELDLVTSDSFAAILENATEHNVDPVVVSLEQCTYVDSTALNILIAVNKRIGPRLSVVIPRGNPCRRVFDICGMDKVMRISTSVDEALAATRR
jgi:anti-sigma B factor antagonist